MNELNSCRMTSVVRAVLDTAPNQEKHLIFCSRMHVFRSGERYIEKNFFSIFQILIGINELAVSRPRRDAFAGPKLCISMNKASFSKLFRHQTTSKSSRKYLFENFF